MTKHGTCATCGRRFAYSEFWDDEARYVILKDNLYCEKFCGIPLFIVFLGSLVYLAGVLIGGVNPWATTATGVGVGCGLYGSYSVVRIITEFKGDRKDRFKTAAREVNGEPKCEACIAGRSAINESSSLTGLRDDAKIKLEWKEKYFLHTWSTSLGVFFSLEEFLALAFFLYFAFSLKEKEFKSVAVGSLWSAHLIHSFRIEACVYAGVVLIHHIIRVCVLAVGKGSNFPISIVDIVFSVIAAIYFPLAGSIPWMVLGRTLTLPWKLRALIFLFCFHFVVSIGWTTWCCCGYTCVAGILEEVANLGVWMKLNSGRGFAIGSIACNVIYFAHLTVVLVLVAFLVAEMFRISGPKNPYCADCKLVFEILNLRDDQGDDRAENVDSAGWQSCDNERAKFSHVPIRLVRAGFNVRLDGGKDYRMKSCAVATSQDDVSEVSCDGDGFVISEMLECSATKTASVTDDDALFFLTASEDDITLAVSKRSAHIPVDFCSSVDDLQAELLWCSTELFLTRRPEVSCVGQWNYDFVKYMFHWP